MREHLLRPFSVMILKVALSPGLKFLMGIAKFSAAKVEIYYAVTLISFLLQTLSLSLSLCGLDECIVMWGEENI